MTPADSSTRLAELEALEPKIAKLLRYGVVFAGLLIFIGWMGNLNFSSNPLAEFHDYKAVSLLESLQLAWQNRSYSLLISYAGLFVLILLPIVRVLMTGILFLKQKDRILAGIAFFVFFAILLSCVLGLEL